MTRPLLETSRIKITLCGEGMEGMWDAFVSEHRDGSLFHRFGWKRIYEQVYGNECFYLIAEEDGSAVGVLPLVFKKSRLFGRFLVSLPYFDHVGICCDKDDVRRLLFLQAQELARERSAEYIELRHDRDHGLDTLTKHAKVAMVLELPSDPEQLWSNIRAKVRNQVRKAEKEGLSAKRGNRELLDSFFEIYAVNMRDLGSPSHGKDFFQYICDTYPDEVCVFCVTLGDVTVASGFTLASKDTLTIPWASSLRKYNSKCSNMLLYWSILKYACESGFSKFSFGRSTPGEGTYRFKKQWGAESKQLYWQYWLSKDRDVPDLNTQNSKYQLPVRLWKSMPVSLTKAIGPRLIQNLP